ncbi:MAG: AMP-binding protein [Pyrinomonadaceae bacterium]|nr:AMP-binding protein [Pyrinomonadaceae bacterium]MCX7639978.1 AMP-binding protein [Pyrinomonadaceae bacterium]MDW8304150.1 AMP-binding protein [Acidobacteriota bacterium]
MTEKATFENLPVVWCPSEDVIEKTELKRFMRQVGVDSWEELYRFSIDDVERFTAEVLKFLGIEFDPPYEKLLDLSQGIQWAKWCVGGGLNITKMCLDRWVNDKTSSSLAIIWEGEEGRVESLTYAELKTAVEACASGLRRHGLKKGDAIGIHLPMMPETVVALLAINRIGAIAVPVFSGYGVEAIATRLNSVQAKALFACDGFPRRGKIFDAFAIAEEAVKRCPSVEKVFLVSRIGQAIQADTEIVKYEDLTAFSEAAHIEPTQAEDPLIILYTSGTTGKPKGIAHVHCGFPIKSAQDMAFGTDVGLGTRICWITDIGWMMGPWLIYGALILGGTITIYDGAPDYPQADRLWEFCSKHKVEILGISPTLVRSLASRGDDLPKKHDLSSLRAFASTGEPWNQSPWLWLFEKVGNRRIPIINYSGGTEISGGILMGNFLLPVKPCSFSAPCPGIDAVILGEDGRPVQKGQVGELCIRKPWIGMARGFWNEPERYLKTYWSRFENIWVHGDWAMQDSDGHWYILGRSDDTLKIAGKRVGPAEVESLLVSHPLVIESAVIGVPDEIKGTKMVAFCVLKGEATEGLKDELKQIVAKEMGKPLAPSEIYFVSALPKTRNAKLMRRVIRAAYLGEDAGDVSALENPQAVEEIRKTSSYGKSA